MNDGSNKGSTSRSGPVPVTLVTGFLGAGKTTLLNHVLDTAGERRFAVVENEFGDLGIDSDLVATPAEAVFALNEGCVCCTVRDDLVELFEQLAARVEDFDHVLVETSGLADPGPVMRVFELARIRAAFRLDGVVTVVDAHHVEKDLGDTETCAEQITYADLLVLNKTDRLSETRLSSLEARLALLNPLARRVRAVQARVPVREVVQLGGHDFRAEAPHEEARPDVHSTHRHDESIASVAVEAAGDIDVDRLDRWLGSLVRRRDIELLRMKGVLAVPGQARRFVFHGVRAVVDVVPGRPWGEETRTNRAVFIGRGLDAAMLRSGFLGCARETDPPRPRAAAGGE
ncbi:MAG: GTP-binding protein [Proteobacteria bacterium]|nr:GTP-binding protein [Pseudomonadota bacterium]